MKNSPRVKRLPPRKETLVATSAPAGRMVMATSHAIYPVALIESWSDGDNISHYPAFLTTEGVILSAQDWPHDYGLIACDWPQSEDDDRLPPIIAYLMGRDDDGEVAA